MTRTIATAVVLSLTLSVLPASAEADDAGATPTVATPAITVPARISDALARPAVLPALYVSYAALQAFDVYSTRQALTLGGRETNPLMQGVAGNTGAFVALKAAVAVGTIAAAERLWKQDNKAAAIAVMVAGTSVAAIVAARNARTLGQLR